MTLTEIRARAIGYAEDLRLPTHYATSSEREEFVLRALAVLAGRVRDEMTTIWKICHIPTPQGTKAYTHFQRDFDQIRAIAGKYINGEVMGEKKEG